VVSGKIRLKFHKLGKLKFISHLDLCRSLKGALGRAGVPIKYSQGFNPHPKMVFALPLPVGAESVCEYLDISLTEPCDEKQLMRDINAQLTSDLQITAIYESKMEFSEIAMAEYEFFFEDFSVEELRGVLAGSLLIEKRSKKGMIEVDLRPKILRYEITEKQGVTRFHSFLGADSNDFVNPELLVRAFERAAGRAIDYYSIMRLALYTAQVDPFK
jgi:radical SAM-linked protein